MSLQERDKTMVVSTRPDGSGTRSVQIVELDDIAVRFAGDSGDGMQLAGTQMTNTSAIFGNDISTLPDYPAEIRAPAGTLAGVSGFQLHFGAKRLRTPGDRINALIAMNPAALKANLADLLEDGIIVVNEDAFTKGNLSKAGYEENPLENNSLSGRKLFRIPMDKLTAAACVDTGLSSRAVARCKNFFALGVTYWLFGRSLEPTLNWIGQKFGSKPAVADANARALRAGQYYGETTEMFQERYSVAPAKIEPGRYRRVSGNEAVALGLIAAAQRANKPLFYGTYPITPASDILHELSRHKHLDVRTFQAEDEIAAMTATVGAAFGGVFAATGTSGPGMALKSEAIGLAVMTELPMVIVNVQRGGPSTGLPTKTEQSDLFQATVGRNGEAPLCVLAASTPADCFDMSIEAFRIAMEYMTPVVLLTDGYLANGAEPWRIPDIDSLPKFSIKHPTDPASFQPFSRDDKLARPWGLPGTPGLEHRIGGLERADITGEVCYVPENHEHMCRLRREKIDRIVETIPLQEVDSDGGDELLIVGWGSTYGAIASAVERCRDNGMKVSHAQLRYIHPMPKNLGEVLRSYKRVLVPEMNLGQLITQLRAAYLVDAMGMHKVQGKPFMIRDIELKIVELLNGSR